MRWTRRDTARPDGDAERAGDHDSERGSALIEFLAIAVLFLVPLAYFVLTVFQLQGAAFAAQGAARDAGRLLQAATDEQEGREAAELAAILAFEDFGLDVPTPDVTIECEEAVCLTPGATIRITVSTSVPLPLLPSGSLATLGAVIPVEAHAVVVVDRFRER